jgi:hypothetical protein
MHLDALFEQRGLASYVYNDRPAESRTNKRLNDGVPGVTFNALAATDNEQGRHSRSLGGSFVHVELESGVRKSAAQRETAAAVIAAAIGAAPDESLVVEDDQDEEPIATVASLPAKEVNTATADALATESTAVASAAVVAEAGQADASLVAQGDAGQPTPADQPRKLP